MSKITDFLRKIGLLHVSKGDETTGEFDSREDLKKTEEDVQTEPAQEASDSPEETQKEENSEMPEETKQM